MHNLKKSQYDGYDVYDALASSIIIRLKLYIQKYLIRVVKLDIKKEAKQLAKENDWDKLHALLYLRTKYESENCTEEAVIVSKLIHEELNHV
jgi:hypothetical protein